MSGFNWFDAMTTYAPPAAQWVQTGVQALLSSERATQAMVDAALELEGRLECYYDLLSQHQAEVAGYGDSWPGAVPQLEKLRSGLRAFAQEHGLRDPFAPVEPVARRMVIELDNGGEIPF